MAEQSTTPATDSTNRSPDWIGDKKIEGGLKRSAVRSWAVTAFAQGAQFGLTLVSTAIIARILTPADYGLIAMVTALLTFISRFKDLGLSQATVQRDTITEQQVSGLFWFNVAMGLFVMLLTAAAAPLVSRFYDQAELTWVCLAYAAMAPVSSLGAQHGALLRRTMQYRSLAVRDLLATVLGVIAGIVSAMQGLGYWSLVIMRAVSEVMGTATLWWQSGWRPGPPRWSADLKPMLKFGGTLTVSNLLGFILSGLDSVVMGFFYGPTALGLYNRAQNTLSRPLAQILPPIMNVAASVFARSATDQKKFESGALQLAFLIACVSTMIVAIVVVGADWIVLIMLGPNWSEAVPITRVLALFAFVEPVASLLSTLMTARGLVGKMVRWRVVSAAIIVVGLISGLPWGALGVAAAYALSGFFVRTPLFVWYSCNHLNIPARRLFASIALPLLFGSLTVTMLSFLRHYFGDPGGPLLSLVLYASLAAAMFVISMNSLAATRMRIREIFNIVSGSVGDKA